MKKLFSIANAYAAQSDWTDFALVKFCLAAMGMALGLSVPEKRKKPALLASIALFAVTYAPLMARFFRVVRQYGKTSAKDGNSH